MRTDTYDPELWQLVPKEPTVAQLDQIDLVEGWTQQALRARYKALLQHSPTPPASAQSVEPVAIYQITYKHNPKYKVKQWEDVSAEDFPEIIDSYEKRILYTKPPSAEDARDAVYQFKLRGLSGWNDCDAETFAKLQNENPSALESLRALYATPSEARADLHKFMDAAAGEGYVLDGVDAADLYISLFPKEYADALKSKKEA